MRTPLKLTMSRRQRTIDRQGCRPVHRQGPATPSTAKQVWFIHVDFSTHAEMMVPITRGKLKKFCAISLALSLDSRVLLRRFRLFLSLEKFEYDQRKIVDWKSFYVVCHWMTQFRQHDVLSTLILEEHSSGTQFYISMSFYHCATEDENRSRKKKGFTRQSFFSTARSAGILQKRLVCSIFNMSWRHRKTVRSIWIPELFVRVNLPCITLTRFRKNIVSTSPQIPFLPNILHVISVSCQQEEASKAYL